jgi:outer membrane receptor protein involved in Fe transport
VTEDWLLKTQVDYDWTGRSNGSYQIGNPDYYNPSYGVMNLSIGLEADRYEVALYAKNLLDNKEIIQSPEINTVVEGYTVRPMTIGMTAKYKFGP